MLKLNIIEHNPAGAIAVTWFGVIFVSLVAVIIVGVWFFAVFRAGQDLGDLNADDPALERLRHRRFVVRRPRRPRGTQANRGIQANIVSELEPAGESEPTG